ncbi:MAG: protoheme IX farnesyltransferase [Armatimonadetes bacterium]|nr:protoheme IX farnesyltransferase [Armatimonadota bacterium]
MWKPRFHQYAWGLLAYVAAVVLGGAFVRASLSGDGCGAHWPDCNSQLIPDGTRLATLIEFAHRQSTTVLVLLVIGLVVWAHRAYPKGDPTRAAAWGVLGMTVVEALIGAALVLFRWVARDESVGRAVVMPLHLAATLILLLFCVAAAWFGAGGARPQYRADRRLTWILGGGLLAMVLLGMTGAVTALGDTLFPAGSLAEGWQQKFAPGAHFLQTLRILHPIVAVAVGLYLAVAAGIAMRSRPSPAVERAAQIVLALFLVQVGLGMLNLHLLAPIWMQLIHLLAADSLWVAQVLLCLTALTEPASQPNAAGAGQSEPATGAGGLGWRSTVRAYVALTKPRVISLLLFTAVTAMFIAARAEGLPAPGLGLCLVVSVGFYMAAGAANAINMVLERDLDERMGRTQARPIVTHQIPAHSALIFAFLLTVGSFGLLWSGAGLLSATMALAGLAFYVLIYTLLLKRRTWTNIVIGGAAGAFPPLVGWAAVAQDLGPLAWCLFAIIFLWTPVHFWALALLLKEDYRRAGVPMLPVVKGVQETVRQIVGYAVLTTVLSLLPLWLQGRSGQASAGWFYGVVVVLLNVWLVRGSLRLYRTPEPPEARSLFKFSMAYLALLFLALAADPAGGLGRG